MICHVFLNRTLPSIMTRAHRVALIATVVTVTYLLLFFNILPVPLDAKIAEQILIVVTKKSFPFYCSGYRILIRGLLHLFTDPLVASCFVWFLLFMVDWDRSG